MIGWVIGSKDKTGKIKGISLLVGTLGRWWSLVEYCYVGGRLSAVQPWLPPPGVAHATTSKAQVLIVIIIIMQNHEKGYFYSINEKIINFLR